MAEELIGKLLDYSILRGIIPDSWTEYAYEYETNFSIYVEGQMLPDKEWQELVETIKAEFGDKLMDIYGHSPNGIHFIVYLKK